MVYKASLHVLLICYYHFSLTLGGCYIGVSIPMVAAITCGSDICPPGADVRFINGEGGGGGWV